MIKAGPSWPSDDGPVLLRRIAHSGHPCPARATESRRRACHSGGVHARRRLRLVAIYQPTQNRMVIHTNRWKMRLNKKCPHGYRQILATPTCGQIVHAWFRRFEHGFFRVESVFGSRHLFSVPFLQSLPDTFSASQRPSVHFRRSGLSVPIHLNEFYRPATLAFFHRRITTTPDLQQACHLIS